MNDCCCLKRKKFCVHPTTHQTIHPNTKPSQQIVKTVVRGDLPPLPRVLPSLAPTSPPPRIINNPHIYRCLPPNPPRIQIFSSHKKIFSHALRGTPSLLTSWISTMCSSHPITPRNVFFLSNARPTRVWLSALSLFPHSSLSTCPLPL